MALERTLLIGNGLNRCLGKGSWDNLLEKIAKDNGIVSDGSMPMPLEFERLVNLAMENKKKKNSLDTIDHLSVKTDIAEMMKKWRLPPDAIHRKFKSSNIQNIITLNYDFLLEKAYSEEFEMEANEKNPIKKGEKEKRIKKEYLYNSQTKLDGVNFFHAHGHIGKPQSICLGYENYAGYIEKLRSKLNPETGGEHGKMKICQILRGEDESTQSWAELFYTSDIDVIGVGLDTCEIDLWWLLTHRAFLYYSNYGGDAKALIKNRITFHKILPQQPSSNEQGKATNFDSRRKLLRGLNVQVELYPLRDGESYQDKYEAIAKALKL